MNVSILKLLKHGWSTRDAILLVTSLVINLVIFLMIHPLIHLVILLVILLVIPLVILLVIHLVIHLVAELQYTSWWDGSGMKFEMGGMDPTCRQKNRDGWLVGVWDGDRWDPSHPFRIPSHFHPTWG